MSKRGIIRTILLLFVVCSCFSPIHLVHALVKKQLIIYSPNSQTILSSIIPAFEEKYNVKITVVRGSTGVLFQKIKSEKYFPKADLMFGGNAIQLASQEELFQPFEIKNRNKLLTEPVSNKIIPYALNGTVIVVNKQLTKHLNIQGYEDLLKSDLKGKVAFGNPEMSSSAFSHLINMLFFQSNNQKIISWDFVQQFLKQNKGIREASSSVIYQDVIEGKMVAGLVYEDMQFSSYHSNILEMVYPKEGTLFMASSVSIVKDAQHKKLASLFIDFLLSKRVQENFVTTSTNRPIRSDIKEKNNIKPFSSIKSINIDNKKILKERKNIYFTKIQKIS
ncbi:hypothetical protein HMPREF9318_01464 [Streptococcus urinalis FB127-CNA-2]|uniref:ABC transporter, solute-binding protein n=1 Tax=Streptococcus urinalis 2285-97 TaxID=764291 RepID=G5KDK1_9STRE|nr:extracellular solute-binding protein [Streptococcus urinalis]EHJ57024.1 ABC transporter, solute-binding protein [Streptococcus urinalis 2285-97]EKS19388.1 hypothetical protein HMPREF9318_01464 [Streptococcus urinalis FB127-CNA-2]VEF31519.1 iron(III)-binding protein [Streptococcus urinalis]